MLDIFRRAALRPKPGHEEPRVGHRLPQLGQLFGIGRSDHGSHRAVAARACCALRCILDEPRDVLVDPLTVLHDQILKQAAARIRCLDQHKDSGLAFHRQIHKRIQTIGAQIGADRQCVATPSAGRYGTKIGGRVGSRRRPDVVSLAVDHHHQSFARRVRNRLGQRQQPGRSQLLKKRGLRFDDRHERCYDVNHIAAKERVRVRHSLKIFPIDARS